MTVVLSWNVGAIRCNAVQGHMADFVTEERQIVRIENQFVRIDYQVLLVIEICSLFSCCIRLKFARYHLIVGLNVGWRGGCLNWAPQIGASNDPAFSNRTMALPSSVVQYVPRGLIEGSIFFQNYLHSFCFFS